MLFTRQTSFIIRQDLTLVPVVLDTNQQLLVGAAEVQNAHNTAFAARDPMNPGFMHVLRYGDLVNRSLPIPWEIDADMGHIGKDSVLFVNDLNTAFTKAVRDLANTLIRKYPTLQLADVLATAPRPRHWFTV